jgi:hypothetical protein
MLRPAAPNSSQRAEIQWRSATGAYQTVATVHVSDPSNVFTQQLKPPGGGFIRIAWRAPSGQVVHSRAAPIGRECRA